MSDQLTLRDKFAVEALNGMLAGRPEGSHADVKIWSEAAYAQADAMLAARKEPTAQVERLLERIRLLEEERDALRELQPVLSTTEHVTAVALSELWTLLGASNQTEAVGKLRGLLK